MNSGSRTPPHNWKGKSGWMLDDEFLLQNLPLSKEAKANDIA